MGLLIEVPKKTYTLAGKVAGRTEIRSAVLIETKAHLDVDRLRALSSGGKRPAISVDVMTPRATGQLTKNGVLQTKLRFRLGAHLASQPATKLFLVTAIFLFEYQLTEGFRPTNEEIRAFASCNSTFNGWPFWREFAQNMAMKMGLPPMTLPFLRVRAREAREKS